MNNSTLKILIADDDPGNLNLLISILEPENFEILAATNGKTALKLAKDTLPDLILLDVVMPQVGGFEICRQLKESEDTEEIPVLFITGKTEECSVAKAFDAGGMDYIQKPIVAMEVISRVKHHLRLATLKHALIETNERLRKEAELRAKVEIAYEEVDSHLSAISEAERKRWGISGFIGKSGVMHSLSEQIRKIQRFPHVNVLLKGESGTGKEIVARAVHYGSANAKRPFLAVNCSAIPEKLAESFFFGHVKGAFTGADTANKGYFEKASGGTLFLDEIADLPMSIQPMLLRVLESGKFLPVGSSVEKEVIARVVAASHVDLREAVAKGHFRSDLFYRLDQFSMDIPSLRERRGDIPLLADYFLKEFASEMKLNPQGFSPDALKTLMAYSFPGNIRELKNLIERALIETGNGQIESQHLRLPSCANSGTDLYQMPLNIRAAEIALMKRAIAESNGNIQSAAKLLGVDRNWIYRRSRQNSVSEAMPSK